MTHDEAGCLTWWKLGIVLLSVSAFAFCLTQLAYIEFTGVRFNGVDETADNTSMSLFFLGLRVFPWVLGAGIVLAIPLWLVPYVVHGFIEWKLGRSVPVRRWVLTLLIFVVAALWISGLLALLSWFANPLLLATWFLFLFSSRSVTFGVAVLTAILMISYLNVAPLPIGWKDAPIHIKSFSVGYWAWLASAVVMIAASFPYKATMHLYRTVTLTRT